MQTDQQSLRTEGNKLLHDTMKQLVTISTGSILLIVAFLEKIFSNPHWKILVAISFIAFLICIVASLWEMRTISLNVGASYRKDFQPTERIVVPISIWSFSAATIALVVFVVKNLSG